MSNVTRISPSLKVLAESPRAGLRLQVERHNGRLVLTIADETGAFELGELLDDRATALLHDFLVVALSEFGETVAARVKEDS